MIDNTIEQLETIGDKRLVAGEIGDKDGRQSGTRFWAFSKQKDGMYASLEEALNANRFKHKEI